MGVLFNPTPTNIRVGRRNVWRPGHLSAVSSRLSLFVGLGYSMKFSQIKLQGSGGICTDGGNRFVFCFEAEAEPTRAFS